MDVSEQYIKMCDCEEIQSLWKPQSGDYIKLTNDGWIVCTGCVPAEEWKDEVWIPRQDQLQGIIDIEREWTVQTKENTWGYGSLDNDSGFYDETGFWDTLEKMWLSWYMKEKHNKTWDENKWQ